MIGQIEEIMRVHFFRLVCGFLVSSATIAQAQVNSEPARTLPETTPWALRYVLKIDTPYFFDIRATRGRRNLANPRAAREQELEAIAGNVRTYVVENRMFEREEVFSTLALEFAPDGQLITRVSWPQKLGGHIDEEGRVFLSAEGESSPVFGIATLEEYEGKDAKLYSPAICSGDDDRRYLPGFKPTSVSGNFGCREWSYYLHNAKLPYIDVTTYQVTVDPAAKPVRRGRAAPSVSATIKPVIGWGRFDISPKPVIGKHGDSWFCLHDCPDGDRPSYIPNIKSWLARHNWPMPKIPKKMPLFPDRQY